MGFNSTILILNDRLHEISEDPQFGKKVCDAIRVFGYDKRITPYITGQTSVIDCHHADTTSVVAVGGNCASVMGHVFGCDHYKNNGQLDILKQLAENMGYVLKKEK